VNIKEQIKADRLRARKDRDEVTTGTLTYIMGQIELQEKSPNAPKDVPVAVIKSHIKSVKENVEAIGKESDHAKAAFAEIELLQKYLPEQITAEDIRKFCTGMCGGGVRNKGEILKAIKNTYGAAVDMKEASQIVAEFVNG